jgi:rod shape-determining protein MreC
MDSFFVRYRNLLMLLVMLVAQLVGLAVQVRRTDTGRGSLDAPDSSGVRLIRLWANWIVKPPELLIHSSKTNGLGLWQNYVDLRHIREENQDLQKTIDRLRLEQAALLEDAHQGQRLQALLAFQEKYVYSTMAAQAIGSSGSDQSRVFYLDKGAADGLDRDMAVITADGIVGKVREVFPHSAQVLAINDQTSGAGVILETTRIRGILRGNAAGQPQIVGLLADQRIKPGEKVLTAGGDQVFPRGLPVGVVDKVVRDPDRDSFIFVMVTPAAHLAQLDEVLVITSTQPRFSAEQKQDLATSEALKGADVAAMKEQAIKEQKKASEIMGERLPGLTDPNAPPPVPLAPGSTPPPSPAVKPPQALHPDRYSPGGAAEPEPGPAPAAGTGKIVTPGKSAAPGKAAAQGKGAGTESTKPNTKPNSDVKTKQKQEKLPGAPAKPAPKAESKPEQDTKPGRNP